MHLLSYVSNNQFRGYRVKPEMANYRTRTERIGFDPFGAGSFFVRRKGVTPWKTE
jgi:hypothetical protein